jgi:glycosyltransferase involved in cell wall biosynthesis
MHIGFDGRGLTSPAGGVRRYTAELIRALPSIADDVRLTVFGSDERVSLPVGATWRPVQRLAPTNLGWSVVDLPRAVRRTPVDVFHSPAYTAPFAGVRPLVLTIHDVSYERHPEWYPYKRDALRRWFYRRSALSADRVVTDSVFSRDEIAAAYGIPVDRISVIPLGVGPPFTDEAVRGPHRHDVREPYLLHVGDLHPRRNLGMLVRAVARLPTNAPLLVLAGADRGERAALEREAAKARVELRFVTTFDDSELAGLYSRAAAFVYPSRYEGFGLPLLEAMACGAPVIAARAASIPEVVGDAGVLFDPDDEEDLLHSIVGVLEDSARGDRLRAAGRARAAQFRWERTARETLDVYRALTEPLAR